MALYDVRVFEVPQERTSKPRELSPATVQARDPFRAQAIMRDRLMREGRAVRAVSIHPDPRTGRVGLVAYIGAQA